MRDRILTLINLILILVCGGCIYLLATEEYREPTEIREARQILNGAAAETNLGAATKVKPTPTPTPKIKISMKPIFVSIWTPTPTPTPTPAPTPMPPDLNSVLEAWTITMIDGNNVEFQDRRDESTFVLTVGGPPKETVDKDQKPISVSLISADQNTNSVWLSSGDQKLKKDMSN